MISSCLNPCSGIYDITLTDLNGNPLNGSIVFHNTSVPTVSGTLGANQGVPTDATFIYDPIHYDGGSVITVHAFYDTSSNASLAFIDALSNGFQQTYHQGKTFGNAIPVLSGVEDNNFISVVINMPAPTVGNSSTGIGLEVSMTY